MAMSSLTYNPSFSVEFFVKFGLIWFSGFREEDLNVIFYQNMPNLYKSAERKIPQKNSDYMLKLLKIKISSIVHCCFIVNQSELKY
jgi:hypothetical protein